jgi:hypothetical protein
MNGIADEPPIPGPTKIALAAIYPATLAFVMVFRSGAVKTALFGAAAGLGLAAAAAVLRSPSARIGARNRMRRNALPAASAFLYLLVVWISTLRTGLAGQTTQAAVASVLLFLLFVVFPILTDRRAAVLYSVKAFVVSGMATIIVTWGMLAARLAAGLPWGVASADSLQMEKKAIVDALSAPFILRGPFLHPNTLGLVCAGLIAGLFILRADEQRPHVRQGLGACLALCVLTLAASVSVIAAFPALLAAAGMTVFAGSRAWDRGLRAAAVAGILFFNFAVAAGLNLDYLDRLPIHSSTRVELWDRAIEIAREQPIWGLGRGGVEGRLPYGMSAHNTIIETALERGLPAMAFSSLVFILLLLRLPPARDPLSRGILHLVLAAVFLSAFEVLPLGSLWVMSADVLALAVPFVALGRTLDSPAPEP